MSYWKLNILGYISIQIFFHVAVVSVPYENLRVLIGGIFLKFILTLLDDSDKVIYYIGSSGLCIIFFFCQLFSMFTHCFYDFRMLL